MSDETGEYIDLQSWIWELDSLSFADILFSELCDDGLATVQLRIMTHLVQRRKPFVFFWNSVACSTADLRSSAPHSLNFPIVQKLIHEINCRSCADLCLSGICPLERDRVTSQTDLSANCFHSLSEMEFSGNLHLQKNIVLSWKTGFSRFIVFCFAGCKMCVEWWCVPWWNSSEERQHGYVFSICNGSHGIYLGLWRLWI